MVKGGPRLGPPTPACNRTPPSTGSHISTVRDPGKVAAGHIRPPKDLPPFRRLAVPRRSAPDKHKGTPTEQSRRVCPHGNAFDRFPVVWDINDLAAFQALMTAWPARGGPEAPARGRPAGGEGPRPAARVVGRRRNPRGLRPHACCPDLTRPSECCPVCCPRSQPTSLSFLEVVAKSLYLLVSAVGIEPTTL